MNYWIIFSFIFSFSLSSFAQEIEGELNFPQKIPSASELLPKVEQNEDACALSENKSKEISKEISKERLKQCYTEFPDIMSILFLVSDDDFKNTEKKEERKIQLGPVVRKNTSSFKQCTQDILQYSKENNDKKNQQYIELRMSEIQNALKEIAPDQLPLELR